MTINVTSQKELADLAKLLLKEYLIYYERDVDCCNGTSTPTPDTPNVLDTIFFIAGDPGKPAIGDSAFYIKKADGSLYTDVTIEVYRRGKLITDYTFDIATGKITLAAALEAEETIYIKIFSNSIFVAGQVVPIITGFPYTLPITLL